MTTLREAVEEYLVLRRGVGYKLREPDRALRKFVSFAEHERCDHITVELGVRWVEQRRTTPPQRNRWLSYLRRFARHRIATDPRTQIPPPRLLGSGYVRRSPYLYTDEEVAALIEAAGKLRPRAGLRPRTISTLIGLLAATGLRSGEALALDRADVDLAEGLLRIRHGKFGKSRLVPIHPSTCRALEDYARQRDRILPRPTTPAFFVSDPGARVDARNLSWTFCQLRRRAGLSTPSHRRPPRLHDLRHRFATLTLLRWYRQGVDVEARISTLSTYLGHVKVTNTYWYLSAIPELLACAADRLSKHSGGLL